MTVESRQEKGTTICLYLPLLEARNPASLPSSLQRAAQGRPAHTTPSHIMIVQQRDELRAVLRDMVESLGFQHTEYASCDEALQDPERAATDLVIVDESLGTPAIDRLLAGCKGANERCRTLMLTVSPHANHGSASACDQLLIKPFNFAELQTAVKTSLNSIEEDPQEPVFS